MKFSTILTASLAYAGSAAAWSIRWHSPNGQHTDSSDTVSGRCTSFPRPVQLDWYNVNFHTPAVPDPNRVRVWSARGCSGSPSWTSKKHGKVDVIPNRNVGSYMVDHD